MHKSSGFNLLLFSRYFFIFARAKIEHLCSCVGPSFMFVVCGKEIFQRESQCLNG